MPGDLSGNNFFEFIFEFISRKLSHEHKMCSVCRGRGLFFQVGKDLSNVWCTLLIVYRVKVGVGTGGGLEQI